MGERTYEIEEEIASERQKLGRNLRELEGKAKELKDWRTYYRRSPLAFIGAAVGAGAAVAFMLPSRSGYRDTLPFGEPASEYRAPEAGFRAATLLGPPATRIQEQAVDTWGRIVDALVGVATAKAIEFVGRNVPGFSNEYSRRYPDENGHDFEAVRH